MTVQPIQRFWLALVTGISLLVAQLFLLPDSSATQLSRSRGSTISVGVDSLAGWQSTGIRVESGKRYGMWQSAGGWTVDYRNFPEVDGAGYPSRDDAKIFRGCKYINTLPYGFLLARIDGKVLPVGRGQTFVAHRDGTLELRINDADWCLGDNSGSLHLKVQESLDSKGVLKKLAPWLFDSQHVRRDSSQIVNQLRNLTPDERQRLGELSIHISECTAANILTKGVCVQLALDLLSFLVAPQEVE